MGEVESLVNGTDHQEPLLFSSPHTNYDSLDDHNHVLKKKNLCSILVKWVLRTTIWVVSISWIILMFMFPVEWFHLKFDDWIKAAAGTVYGIAGRVLLAYSLPIVIVAILAISYKAISESEEEEEYQLQLKKRDRGKSSYRVWTFPAMVDGVFGVVSAAELIGLVVLIFYIIYSFVFYTLRNIKESESSLFSMSYVTGGCFGSIGLCTAALLFLPIARGSALLRLIDVPFEHATKYHIWLGHLTMLLFTLHSVAMGLAYTSVNDFISIFSWGNYDSCNLAGVIALITGLLMWITSIHPIREKYFETFFYSHQLYVVFLIFFSMHVGDFYFSMMAGGLFIFMLDRFLRFWQSQSVVDVISAKYHSCGVVELALSKPANLRYSALSFIFVRIREVSWLQWHPFSVSSSPLDGEKHISVMMKVQGDWTSKLRDHILRNGGDELNYKLTASVEGPYGQEFQYYTMYANLILVAGGVGISPFLAILSDILHRIRDGKPCLPVNILLVWAVKKSNELSLSSKINMESICPSFSTKLNLETRIYVTQESDPPMEEGVQSLEWSSTSTSNGHAVSCLVGTGNSKWVGIYFIASTVGFVIIKVLLYVYYVNALDVRPWWYKGLLLLASMAAGVVLFGGLVLCLWHLRERENRVSQCESDISSIAEEEVILCNGNEGLFGVKTYIQYGSRPNFQDIFDKWEREEVGVIVCGPSNMEASVARECRTLNLRRKGDGAVFHFHTHSFSL